MAKTIALALPSNAGLTKAFAKMEANEGANTVLDFWQHVLAEGGLGLQVGHSTAVADRILEIKRRAFRRNNQFLSAKVLKEKEPKERRADKTYATSVLTLLANGKAAATTFTAMCTLSKSVDVVANACDKAMEVHAKTGALPDAEATAKIVKACATKKREPGTASVRKASTYLGEVVRSLGALQKAHPKFERDSVVNMLKSAKQSLKIAEAADAAAKKAKEEADKAK